MQYQVHDEAPAIAEPRTREQERDLALVEGIRAGEEASFEILSAVVYG